MNEFTISQARSFARQTITFTLESETDPLAYLTTAGIAIELYIKALIIREEQNGTHTQGHDPASLYSELPEFLRTPLSQKYKQQLKGRQIDFQEYAYIISQDQPERPSDDTPSKDYNTIESALLSLSNIFTRCRYFFEEIKEEDYAIFAFPKVQIEAIFTSLDEVYIEYPSPK